MTLPADADRLLATLRTGAWLDAQVFPPLSYAVPGLIPKGSVLLVGAPQIGKSWLVLGVGLAAASGGKALGLDIPKRPVLYLALEDGDRRL
jgi:RecA-family ATPase